MTVRQAAEKWGVSIRLVQVLLNRKRIDGAVRFDNHAWMIPMDAEKPGDPRFVKKENSLSRELADVLSATWVSAPPGNPAAILRAVKDEIHKAVLEIGFAYARGDFEPVKRRFMEIENDAVKLAASPAAIAAAIGMGDYPFYLRIESWLKHIVKANVSAGVTAFAELALAGAYLGAGAPRMTPEWLKNGDFTALPDMAKRLAAYARVQYFRWLGNHELTLAVAQTSLALCDDGGLTFEETNLRLLCAASCLALGRHEDAENYLLDAMRKQFSEGCIVMFAETAALFGGMLERLILREYPARYDDVISLNKRVFPNWLSFHNRFTKDNITLILTLREYEIALLATRGVPYKEIADQFDMTTGTLSNKMQAIQARLLITGPNRRKTLAKYIL